MHTRIDLSTSDCALLLHVPYNISLAQMVWSTNSERDGEKERARDLTSKFTCAFTACMWVCACVYATLCYIMVGRWREIVFCFRLTPWKLYSINISLCSLALASILNNKSDLMRQRGEGKTVKIKSLAQFKRAYNTQARARTKKNIIQTRRENSNERTRKMGNEMDLRAVYSIYVVGFMHMNGI